MAGVVTRDTSVLPCYLLPLLTPPARRCCEWFFAIRAKKMSENRNFSIFSGYYIYRGA